MKIITAAIVALLLLGLTGCSRQDKSSGDPASSPTSESIPKVDLHSAVVTEDYEVIRQHIEAGSDLNVLEPSRASTPLISAAFAGKTEAARMLIEAGAELNYQNADGSTALHTAAAFGKTEVARLLIDSGAELDYQNKAGSTALHTAAFFGHPEIVKALLEKGADKTIVNGAGKTALETVEGPFEELKTLYDAIGAELNPLGLRLDYDQIKAARPKIAAMLKQEL